MGTLTAFASISQTPTWVSSAMHLLKSGPLAAVSLEGGGKCSVSLGRPPVVSQQGQDPAVAISVLWSLGHCWDQDSAAQGYTCGLASRLTEDVCPAHETIREIPPSGH